MGEDVPRICRYSCGIVGYVDMAGDRYVDMGWKRTLYDIHIYRYTDI